jgi:hypothetical protein
MIERSVNIMGIQKRICKRAFLSFFLSLLIFAFTGVIAVHNKINVEKLQMEGLIHENIFRIKEVVSEQLYQTKALAALVIQGDGVVNNFQKVASVIAQGMPALANFLLAPDGIVTDVYPVEGNQAVIGLDFFNEINHAGNKEAVLARDIGELVMAGPFMLRQGIMGLTGRYPVYIETEEISKFWGLVSVSLKFPDALDNTGLSMLEYQGFSYELWRINPDTHERQTIAGASNDSITNYIELPVTIFNAEWYLRIFPIRSWYQHPESWLLIFAGLCISVLVAALVQSNVTLKLIRSELNKNLADKRISIMLSQIKPHFLYNALTAIAQLCSEDPEKAKSATINFSAYLRSNMQSIEHEGFISFKNELNHIKSYLDLEKAIYGSTLNVVYNIGTDNFSLPPLTVQPIVENAVKHGIGRKVGGGTVTISTAETGDSFIITISDNGAGFIPADTIDEREHIGTVSVRNRLRQQCNATLELSSEPEIGTTAVIKIPKQGGD